MRTGPARRAGRLALVAGALVSSGALLSACIVFAAPVTMQASPAASSLSIDVAFVDVTGDGADDPLVLSAPPAALGRLSRCGSGCWQREEAIPVSASAHALATADFDGDDIQDVAVTADDGVTVFFGAADGLDPDDSVVVDTAERHHVIAGDLDGDGDVGVLGPSPSASTFEYAVIAGDGTGAFAAPVGEASWSGPSVTVGGLAAGDVTGDGDLEAMVSVNGQPMTIFNFVFSVGDDPGDDYSGVASGYPVSIGGLTSEDLDGDGSDDVAVIANSPIPGFVQDAVTLLRSTGSSFVGHFSVTNTAPSSEIELRDIDGDGATDLIASDPATNKVSFWHGDGAGRFRLLSNGQYSRIQRDAGPQPSAMAFGRPAPGALADLIVSNANQPFAQVSYLTNQSVL